MTSIMDFGGTDLQVNSISTGYTKPGGVQGTTAQTFPGDVTVSGTLYGSIDTRAGAGAISLTSLVTLIETDSADAITLADGTEGQLKILIMTTDNGAGTVTPTNYGNGSTLTFDDVGDSAFLVFADGNWQNVGTPTATVG